MKLIFFLTILGIFIPLASCKELMEHGYSKKFDKMLIDLVKRLGSSDYNYLADQLEQAVQPESTESEPKQSSSSTLQSNTQQNCEKNTQSEQIIIASDSLKAGANYVDSIKGVQSNQACLSLCCNNSTCDVAVFQDKGDHYCYLFQCQGKCLFKDHKGYYVSHLSRKKQQLEPPEKDLQNLHEDSSKKDESTEEHQVAVDQAGVNPPAITDAAPADPPKPYVAPHSADVNGFCTEDLSCEDPNAGCVNSVCQCKNGYYLKERICRKVCPPSYFECLQLGTMIRGPECVPGSQVCDSYMQCADGSDEYNCENIAGAESKSEGHGPSGKSKTQEGSEQGAKSHAGKPVQPSNPKKFTSQQATSPAPKESKTSTTSNQPKKDHENSTVTHKAPEPKVSENEKVFMSREKVIIASASSQAEGPIIALSLGLAFTVILLVLVACRLRSMRHRLRKGRPLHSNEADYLINGMYL